MLVDIIGDDVVHDGDGTTPYYSPPFGRGGEAAVFSIEVTHVDGSPTMVVGVDHRNVDESNWSSAGTFSDITAASVATKELSGLKEELRFAFTFTVGVGGDFMHVLIPAPMWLPY